MGRLVSTLTASMLLVHALFGCCCRCEGHSHAGCERPEAIESTVVDCCHHESVPQGHESERPLAPCDCKLACNALCVSLPPEKALIDVGWSTPSIDIVAISSTIATIDATGVQFRFDTMRSYGVAAPPLRLHLLHQIILV